MEHIILTNSDPIFLSSQIEDYLKAGWKLHGNLIVIQSPIIKFEIQFVQAMTK